MVEMRLSVNNFLLPKAVKEFLSRFSFTRNEDRFMNQFSLPKDDEIFFNSLNSHDPELVDNHKSAKFYQVYKSLTRAGLGDHHPCDPIKLECFIEVNEPRLKIKFKLVDRFKDVFMNMVYTVLENLEDLKRIFKVTMTNKSIILESIN